MSLLCRQLAPVLWGWFEGMCEEGGASAFSPGIMALKVDFVPLRLLGRRGTSRDLVLISVTAASMGATEHGTY